MLLAISILPNALIVLAFLKQSLCLWPLKTIPLIVLIAATIQISFIVRLLTILLPLVFFRKISEIRYRKLPRHHSLNPFENPPILIFLTLPFLFSLFLFSFLPYHQSPHQTKHRNNNIPHLVPVNF